MPIGDRWTQFDESDWEALARTWFSALRGEPGEPQSDIEQSIVLMNFTASPDQQWQFILAALRQAQTDDELGHIAAGPLEHLLGHHGADYIDVVEEQVATDRKFARMVLRVWKYMIPDEVWERIQALKERISEQSPTDA